MLNKGMLLANKHKMKDKSSKLLREMSRGVERLKIINVEIGVLKKDSPDAAVTAGDKKV